MAAGFLTWSTRPPALRMPYVGPQGSRTRWPRWSACTRGSVVTTRLRARIGRFRKRSGSTAPREPVRALALHRRNPHGNVPRSQRRWFEPSLRRSALQLLCDQYPVNQLSEDDGEDLGEIDQTLREVAPDIEPMTEEDIPTGLPESHWRWWLPSGKPADTEEWECGMNPNSTSRVTCSPLRRGGEVGGGDCGVRLPCVGRRRRFR